MFFLVKDLMFLTPSGEARSHLEREIQIHKVIYCKNKGFLFTTPFTIHKHKERFSNPLHGFSFFKITCNIIATLLQTK